MTAGIGRRSRNTLSCAGGCSRLLPEALGYAFCPTCWNVNKVCTEEKVGSLAEIARQQDERDMLISEVARALRSSFPERADELLYRLERRLR